MQATTRFALIALLTPSFALAQSRQVSDAVRRFVNVDAQVVALTHVRVIDGTGVPVRNDQTIILNGERVVAVGSASDVRIPSGARELDLSGHTVIPGIIGLHDHMYYSSVAGRMKQMPAATPASSGATA